MLSSLLRLTFVALHAWRQATTQPWSYCAWRASRFPASGSDYSSSREKIGLPVAALLPSVPLPHRAVDDAAAAALLSDCLLPALWVAQEDFRDHPCLLNAYELDIATKDTQCKASIGTKAFFDAMNERPRKVALFGDACTAVNEPIATTAKYWHIVQLSYAETHPKFSAAESESLYPNFYRMIPGWRDLHESRYGFIGRFNWTRVGTVKQSDNSEFSLVKVYLLKPRIDGFALQPHQTFTSQLEDLHGVQVVHTAQLSAERMNFDEGLDELKEKDARIIVGDFNASFAARTLCAAWRRQMVGANYVWLLPSYQWQPWWQHVDLRGVGCSRAQLLQALEGHFAMGFAILRDDDDITLISGGTTSDYRRSYNYKCSRGERPCDMANALHGYFYDGLWTLAVALDQVAAARRQQGSELRPGSLADVKFESLLLEALNRTNFEGVTGRVRFDGTERRGRVDIAYFKNGSYNFVGSFDGSTDRFQLDIDLLKSLQWSPPLDATVVVVQRQYIHHGLFVLMSALATIGMVLAIVFLTINLKFRKHKSIRMSSPYMNNLIIGGSILVYLSMILLGLDTNKVAESHFAPVCYCKNWVLSIGFTLAYGSMFSKTWRVHSIFTNIKLNKKAIKDYKLYLLVGCLLLFDITLLSIWAFASPYSLRVTPLAPERDDARNRVIIPEVEHCYSNNAIVFQAILYTYKGLLMVLGCFLAWETRHVNVPALNDSKYIGMSVYNVVIMCVLGVSLSFMLRDRVNEAYGLICVFICFCTTLTLCLVFAPKIVELIRNPKGTDRHYKRGMLKSVLGRSTKRVKRSPSQLSLESDRDRMLRAKKDNQVWNQLLGEKSKELSELIAKLRDSGDEFSDEKANRRSWLSDDDYVSAVESFRSTCDSAVFFDASDCGSATATSPATSSTLLAHSPSVSLNLPPPFLAAPFVSQSDPSTPSASAGLRVTTSASHEPPSGQPRTGFDCQSIARRPLAESRSIGDEQPRPPPKQGEQWASLPRLVIEPAELAEFLLPSTRLVAPLVDSARRKRLRLGGSADSAQRADARRADEVMFLRARWCRNRAATCPFTIGTKDFANFASFLRESPSSADA